MPTAIPAIYTPTVLAYGAFLLLLASERIIELIISRKHARWAFARGGIEVGQRHFRWMKLLHSAFIPACMLEVVLLQRPFVAPLAAAMLGLALGAQALRYWAIASLGKLWNVRVIVIPHVHAIVRGPYRFIKHPNYLAVIIEGIAVPLLHNAYLTAIIFTLLNAWLLRVRIRCEEHALTQHCAYDVHFGGRARLVPMPPRHPMRLRSIKSSSPQLTHTPQTPHMSQTPQTLQTPNVPSASKPSQI